MRLGSYVKYSVRFLFLQTLLTYLTINYLNTFLISKDFCEQCVGNSFLIQINNNLWEACDRVLFPQTDEIGHESNFHQDDWARRAAKFADNYFGSDIGQMTHCLKDIHNYHKWVNIFRTLKSIDWKNFGL